MWNVFSFSPNGEYQMLNTSPFLYPLLAFINRNYFPIFSYYEVRTLEYMQNTVWHCFNMWPKAVYYIINIFVHLQKHVHRADDVHRFRTCTWSLSSLHCRMAQLWIKKKIPNFDSSPQSILNEPRTRNKKQPCFRICFIYIFCLHWVSTICGGSDKQNKFCLCYLFSQIFRCFCPEIVFV